jgi:hypothetical protein
MEYPVPGYTSPPQKRGAAAIGFLIVIIIVAVGVAAMLFFLTESESTKISERLNTERKTYQTNFNTWNSQAPGKYRIVVQYDYTFYVPFCLQDIEVQNGKIVAVRQNTCSQPGYEATPQNISDLFGRIDKALASNQCGSNGCECDGYIVPEVLYDSKYGYPRSMQLTMKRDNSDPSNLKRSCSNGNFTPSKFTVISFLPLS